MPPMPPTSPSYATPPKRSFFARGWVKLLLVALVGGGIWYGFFHKTAEGPKGPPPVSIRIAPAVQQPVPINVEAVGNVVTYQTVAVRARLDSQVKNVLFHDGDFVKEGDLLFELDDVTLKAQAAQLAANIARDKATLENARHQFERAQALAEKGFATKATLDDTRAAQAVAQAQVGASTAALDNVKAQLQYTRITAPISGRTGTINVTLGNTVKANDATPLVTINQISPIRVQAALPQDLFDEVREAMNKGKVPVRAFKQNITNEAALAEGTLEYIDNEVNQSTGTFITRAIFENPDEKLWPGMYVTLTMTLGQDSNALTVPEVAIQHGQTGDFVFVIAGGKAAKRDVKVARLQNSLAVIGSGVTAGEQVAVDGLLGLKDGVSVTVTADAPAAAPQAATPATTAPPAGSQ